MDPDAKRVFKRIVIALAYLLIIGGIGFTIYLFRQPPAPSCFDKIQNQGEAGVDCGGPCKTCEQKKPLEIFEKAFFLTTPGRVDLFAEVRNVNLAFGVPALRYTFDLYDRDGIFLATRSGITYILPDSTKFIVEHNLTVPKTPDRVEFHFEPPTFEEVRDYVRPRLTVIGLQTRPLDEHEGGFLAVRGNVLNQTNMSFDKVGVAIRLVNQAGQSVAVANHEVRTLVPNENRFFEVKWTYRLPDFTRAEFEVDTNIFEESNILTF